MSDIDDVAFVDADGIARLDPSFDESTHTWTLQDEQSRTRVLIATEGFSAMTSVGRPNSPIDTAVIGFIDAIELAPGVS